MVIKANLPMHRAEYMPSKHILLKYPSRSYILNLNQSLYQMRCNGYGMVENSAKQLVSNIPPYTAISREIAVYTLMHASSRQAKHTYFGSGPLQGSTDMEKLPTRLS